MHCSELGAVTGWWIIQIQELAQTQFTNQSSSSLEEVDCQHKDALFLRNKKRKALDVITAITVWDINVKRRTVSSGFWQRFTIPVEHLSPCNIPKWAPLIGLIGWPAQPLPAWRNERRGIKAEKEVGGAEHGGRWLQEMLSGCRWAVVTRTVSHPVKLLFLS